MVEGLDIYIHIHIYITYINTTTNNSVVAKVLICDIKVVSSNSSRHITFTFELIRCEITYSPAIG